MKQLSLIVLASATLVLFSTCKKDCNNRNCSCDPKTKNLACYYPFDMSTVDVIANTSTNTGYISFGADRAGTSNAALSFNGKNAYIAINNIFDVNERSFSFWFQANTYPHGYAPVLDLGVMMVLDNPRLKNGYVSAYVMSKYDKRWLVLGMSLPGDEQIKIDMGETNSTSESGQALDWNHVVMIQKDQNFTFYLNAQKVAEYHTQAFTSVEGGDDLMLGTTRNNNGRYFDGKLDQFRFYNRALTECEVKYLYQHY